MELKKDRGIWRDRGRQGQGIWRGRGTGEYGEILEAKQRGTGEYRGILRERGTGKYGGILEAVRVGHNISG